MNTNKIVLTLGLAVTINLFGCSDSENVSSGSPSPTAPNTEPTETYTVKAIDGYLQNALVWLDIDNDCLLDEGEPSGLSGVGGVIALDVSNVLNPEQYPVVVHAIAGQTIDEDSDGTPITTGYVMSAPAGEINVTPLSTMVHLIMQESNVDSSDPQAVAEAKQDAITRISGQQGIPENEVLGDFIEKENPQAAYAAMSIVESGQILPTSPEKLQQVMQQVVDDPTSVKKITAVVNEQIRQTVVKTPVSDLKTTPPPITKDDDLSLDSDGDGIPDLLDAFPDDVSEWIDSDGDEKGNNEDLNDDVHDTTGTDDGYPDDSNDPNKIDLFPTDPTRAGDHDGDGVDSLVDAFPEDSTEWLDSDGDKIGDNSDAFPNDGTEWLDSDGDGVGNNKDLNDDVHDTNGPDDGYPDATDLFPIDPSRAGDHDDDGYDSLNDEFPQDATKAGDHDGDGYDSLNDEFPEDATKAGDRDGDGYDDLDDNDPLVALVTPDTYSACLTNLPSYEQGISLIDRTDGKFYQVSKLNLGYSQPVNYAQRELVVRTQKGMPYGLLPNENIVVSQVVTDFGGQADPWNPNLEFVYEHADTGIFLGFNDYLYRWWGLDTVSREQPELTLQTPYLGVINRINKWAPNEENPTNNNFTQIYLGKDIIQTIWGLREVCVVQYQGEFAYVDERQPQLYEDLYIKETYTDYVDAGELVHRSEREYLEYSTIDKVSPENGFTNYVKQLEGFIDNSVLYGVDPVVSAASQDDPLTLDTCVAELSPSMGADTLTFDIEKNQEDGSQRTGVYFWDLITNQGVSWQGKDNLIESQLFGELYNSGSLAEKFSETYYEDDLGVFHGLEAKENGSDEVKWGSVLVIEFDASLAGTYRIPEVGSRVINAVNPDTQYGSWSTGEYTTSTVYLGKETIAYQVEGEVKAVDTCKTYTNSEGLLFNDLSELADTEGYQQTNWYDADGLVKRETIKSDGSNELWLRREKNALIPFYSVCSSQDSGEVASSSTTYQDFIPAASSCGYTQMNSAMLVGTSLYHQESDGFSYGYQFTTQGVGIYTESNGFTIPISWAVNSDGILSITSGNDTEYFALVTTEGDKVSLLGFYVWDENGSAYTEIIGQEFVTSKPPITGSGDGLIEFIQQQNSVYAFWANDFDQLFVETLVVGMDTAYLSEIGRVQPDLSIASLPLDYDMDRQLTSVGWKKPLGYTLDMRNGELKVYPKDEPNLSYSVTGYIADLSNQVIATSISVWSDFTDSSAQFSPGAKYAGLTFTSDFTNYYLSDEPIWVMRSDVGHETDGANANSLTELISDATVSTGIGSTAPSDSILASSAGYEVFVEFVSGGQSNFYSFDWDTGIAKHIGSGSWTLDGNLSEELITYQITPEMITQFNLNTPNVWPEDSVTHSQLVSVYEGVVYRGEFEPAGTEEHGAMLLYTQAARDDIISYVNITCDFSYSNQAWDLGRFIEQVEAYQSCSGIVLPEVTAQSTNDLVTHKVKTDEMGRLTYRDYYYHADGTLTYDKGGELKDRLWRIESIDGFSVIQQWSSEEGPVIDQMIVLERNGKELVYAYYWEEGQESDIRVMSDISYHSTLEVCSEGDSVWDNDKDRPVTPYSTYTDFTDSIETCGSSASFTSNVLTQGLDSATWMIGSVNTINGTSAFIEDEKLLFSSGSTGAFIDAEDGEFGFNWSINGSILTLDITHPDYANNVDTWSLLAQDSEHSVLSAKGFYQDFTEWDPLPTSNQGEVFGALLMLDE
ncbi:hypothetical protein L4D20_18540 [Vibrio kyushuensis]|uniref:hypothetical protein n=1 Tax=Vibrio kyushuensis TaxID=2910249 RepID=UPI003D0DB52A